LRLVISRRAILAGAGGALVARRAVADVDPGWRPRQLDVREIFVDGAQSRRFVLGVPNHLAAGEHVPLLVLLHGLGETGDERMGAWAWFERYGLACPYMPDLPIGDPRAFDAYAHWLVETVVPRARQEASVVATGTTTHLGGVSLGGHFSLEMLLRRPDAFGAWAGVQTAIGAAAGQSYAQKLVETFGPTAAPDLLVETSSGDPFRAGNEALSQGLTRAAVRHTFLELPGPHDQTWLRSSGTARMLGWFDGLRP
jgi:poly(3-hydroxybutyrate) depolymerase